MSLKGSNYPTVRPSLDLQFAQTKRLDPRISYSRSGVATYYDETGILRTAQANEARFDHDPTTGESLGLLVEEARTNQLANSVDLTANWTLSGLSITRNAILSPSRDLTGVLIKQDTTDSIHCALYSEIYFSQGDYLTHTIYVKKYGSNDRISFMYKDVWNNDASSHGYTVCGVVFDFTTESIVKSLNWQSSGFGQLKDFNATKLTNDWYRISYVMQFGTDSNARRVRFAVYPHDVTLSSTNRIGGISAIPAGAVGVAGANYSTLFSGGRFIGDGMSGVYVWGAQLEVGSFPTSYIPTPATFTSRSTTATYYDASGVIQTAGIDVARDDAYLPDENGVFKPAGLLLEEAGTNLLTYSEEFDNAAWAKTNTTVTANAAIAPDGTTTADKIIPNNGTTSADFRKQTLINVNGTFSFYAKPDGFSFIGGQLHTLSPEAYLTFRVDLLTGASSVSTNNISISTQKIRDGWWRISIVGNFGANGFVITPRNDYVLGFTGISGADGIKGAYIWGAQLEASPYPTSYIPTTTSTVTRAADVSTSSTVTRSADVAEITGSNFSSWYNQSEGTVSIKGTTNDISANTGWASFYQASYPNDNRISIRQIPTIYSSAGTTIGVSAFSSPTPREIEKISTAYKNNDFALYSTYSNPVFLSAGLVPVYVDTALLGNVEGGGGGYSLNGHLSRLTYYPVRLPDATLQKLTE